MDCFFLTHKTAAGNARNLYPTHLYIIYMRFSTAQFERWDFLLAHLD